MCYTDSGIITPIGGRLVHETAPCFIKYGKGNVIRYKISQYDLHKNVMGRFVQLKAENPLQHVEPKSYKSTLGEGRGGSGGENKKRPPMTIFT